MTRIDHRQGRAYNQRLYQRSLRGVVSTYLSNPQGDSDNANEVVGVLDDRATTTDSRKVGPFLARALQKVMRKDDDSTTTTTGSTTVSNASNRDTAEENDGCTETKGDSPAEILHALAMKTRLEAEKMEVLLALDKIHKLESRILTLSSNEKRLLLSMEERANLIRDIQVLMMKLNATDATKSSLSINDNTNYNNNQSTTLSLGENNIGNTTKYPVLSYEKQQEAISYFDKLPQPIREMMAKSAGIPTNSNSTAIINKLAEEGRLYESDTTDGQFNILAKAEDLNLEDVDIFVDMEFAEVNSYIQTLLPAVTRKEPVPMEYIDAFYAEVLGKDTFQPSERNPRPVPGGYLIRGTSMVRKSSKRENTAATMKKQRDGNDDADHDDGDILMNVIDTKIMASSVANKIRAYYILDPTPPSGEEIFNDEDESPVLLLTNYDISPNTDAWVKPTVTLMGLISVAVFALGAFAFNANIIDKLSASADNPDENLDWLYHLSLPLASSLLATQIFHELGHFIVAAKDGIQIGMPTLVPGFQFGLTGCITPIKSPPKNRKSLFDFAIAGPIFGLVASIILLYIGIEMTAFMDASAVEQLPTVPVELLRSSALGGGLIDYLLGDGVLNTPDESQMIKLHPFAISGFSGLVLNALSLLPIGNTDGGRICTTFFGRSFSRVVQGTAILVLVLAGFVGADKVNTLLCYAIFCQCWQGELEIPCKNEVDELDSMRALFAIGMSLIVALTLIPLPQ